MEGEDNLALAPDADLHRGVDPRAVHGESRLPDALDDFAHRSIGRLGPGPAAESYLKVDKLLEVIAESGAEAVHPGYGFFSENTDFARAITAEGVAFIGPPTEAIEIMGDKISGRNATRVAGIGGQGQGERVLRHPAGPIGRHLTGQKCKVIRNDQIAIARARLQTGEIAELRCSPCHGVIPG